MRAFGAEFVQRALNKERGVRPERMDPAASFEELHASFVDYRARVLVDSQDIKLVRSRRRVTLSDRRRNILRHQSAAWASYSQLLSKASAPGETIQSVP
jgi:hypothetical protein